MIFEPKPTTRAVIDPLRCCPLKCTFCYYLHHDLTSIFPFKHMLGAIDGAYERGNNYLDFTGGEPLVYKTPEGTITELVVYALNKGMKSCIITSGFAKLSKVKELIKEGIDDFLVSMHGTELVHDRIVGKEGAQRKQIEFLDYIASHMRFRFNFVICRMNQENIFETAKLMANWNPLIVNFINFNPHHEWRNHPDTKNMCANLSVVEKQLNKAIKYLENKGIGVNVRYYPMCRIAEEYRKCVCNDLVVNFDPMEWDYDIQPKTFNAFRKWGIKLSKNTEHHDKPCTDCDLEWICGGINKYFNQATDGTHINAIKGIYDKHSNPIKNDFYHYRKYSITLEDRNGQS